MIMDIDVEPDNLKSYYYSYSYSYFSFGYSYYNYNYYYYGYSYYSGPKTLFGTIMTWLFVIVFLFIVVAAVIAKQMGR